MKPHKLAGLLRTVRLASTITHLAFIQTKIYQTIQSNTKSTNYYSITRLYQYTSPRELQQSPFHPAALHAPYRYNSQFHELKYETALSLGFSSLTCYLHELAQSQTIRDTTNDLVSSNGPLRSVLNALCELVKRLFDR